MRGFDMADEDQTKGHRFEATGPNKGFNIFGVSGFYTNADELDFGTEPFL